MKLHEVALVVNSFLIALRGLFALENHGFVHCSEGSRLYYFVDEDHHTLRPVHSKIIQQHRKHSNGTVASQLIDCRSWALGDALLPSGQLLECVGSSYDTVYVHHKDIIYPIKKREEPLKVTMAKAKASQRAAKYTAISADRDQQSDLESDSADESVAKPSKAEKRAMIEKKLIKRLEIKMKEDKDELLTMSSQPEKASLLTTNNDDFDHTGDLNNGDEAPDHPDSQNSPGMEKRSALKKKLKQKIKKALVHSKKQKKDDSQITKDNVNENNYHILTTDRHSSESNHHAKGSATRKRSSSPRRHHTSRKQLKKVDGHHQFGNTVPPQNRNHLRRKQPQLMQDTASQAGISTANHRLAPFLEFQRNVLQLSLSSSKNVNDHVMKTGRNQHRHKRLMNETARMLQDAVDGGSDLTESNNQNTTDNDYKKRNHHKAVSKKNKFIKKAKSKKITQADCRNFRMEHLDTMALKAKLAADKVSASLNQSTSSVNIQNLKKSKWGWWDDDDGGWYDDDDGGWYDDDDWGWFDDDDDGGWYDDDDGGWWDDDNNDDGSWWDDDNNDDGSWWGDDNNDDGSNDDDDFWGNDDGDDWWGMDDDWSSGGNYDDDDSSLVDDDFWNWDDDDWGQWDDDWASVSWDDDFWSWANDDDTMDTEADDGNFWNNDDWGSWFSSSSSEDEESFVDWLVNDADKTPAEGIGIFVQQYGFDIATAMLFPEGAIAKVIFMAVMSDVVQEAVDEVCHLCANAMEVANNIGDAKTLYSVGVKGLSMVRRFFSSTTRRNLAEGYSYSISFAAETPISTTGEIATHYINQAIAYSIGNGTLAQKIYNATKALNNTDLVGVKVNPAYVASPYAVVSLSQIAPTASPTPAPSLIPLAAPSTTVPTIIPSIIGVSIPSLFPSSSPSTNAPTGVISGTTSPSVHPSPTVTASPFDGSTSAPVTYIPSQQPTAATMGAPSFVRTPTAISSEVPTILPSPFPTNIDMYAEESNFASNSKSSNKYVVIATVCGIFGFCLLVGCGICLNMKWRHQKRQQMVFATYEDNPGFLA